MSVRQPVYVIYGNQSTPRQPNRFLYSRVLLSHVGRALTDRTKSVAIVEGTGGRRLPYREAQEMLRQETGCTREGSVLIRPMTRPIMDAYQSARKAMLRFQEAIRPMDIQNAFASAGLLIHDELVNIALQNADRLGEALRQIQKGNAPIVVSGNCQRPTLEAMAQRLGIEMKVLMSERPGNACPLLGVAVAELHRWAGQVEVSNGGSGFSATKEGLKRLRRLPVYLTLAYVLSGSEQVGDAALEMLPRLLHAPENVLEHAQRVRLVSNGQGVQLEMQSYGRLLRELEDMPKPVRA